MTRIGVALISIAILMQGFMGFFGTSGSPCKSAPTNNTTVLYDGRLSWLNQVASDEACIQATGLTKEEVANLWLTIWKDESITQTGTYQCRDGKIGLHSNKRVFSHNLPNTIRNNNQELGSIQDQGTASVTVGEQIQVMGYLTNYFHVNVEGKQTDAYCIDPLLHNPIAGDYNYLLKDTKTPGTWEYAMANILYCSDVKTEDYINLWNQACASAGADPNAEIQVTDPKQRFFFTHMLLGNTVHNGEFWQDLHGHDAFKVAFGYMYTNLCNYGHASNYRLYLVAVDQSDNAYYQNLVFGAFDPTGLVRLQKVSAVPALVKNNPNYSLAGATYQFYHDAACTVAARQINPTYEIGDPAILTTDASGATGTISLKSGTYYVKETKASTGYQLDPTVKEVHIEPNQTAGVPVVITSNETPITNPPFHILKEDMDGLTIYEEAEDGTLQPSRYGSTLENAVFEIAYYPEYLTLSDAKSKAPAAHWYLKTIFDPTQKQYRIDFDAKHLAAGFTGDPFFTKDGAVVIPFGSLLIREIQAPAGYLSCGDTLIYSNANGLSDLTVRDQAITGNLRFQKNTADTEQAMADVKFVITGEDGSRLEIQTDENGIYDSSHTNPGYFRYGITYTLEECACDVNEEYRHIDPITFVITNPKEVLDLGILYNTKLPSLTTTEQDATTKTHKSIVNPITGRIEIEDCVHYENLEYDRNYILEGVLMELSDSGKVLGPMYDRDHNLITAKQSFTPTGVYTKSRYEACGSETLNYSFSAKGLYGKRFVIYEYLYLEEAYVPIQCKEDGTLDTSAVHTVQGRLICHADHTDENQMGYIKKPVVESVKTILTTEAPTTTEAPASEAPPKTPHQSDAPKTGDDKQILLAAILFLLSGAFAILIMTGHSHKKK